MINIQPTGGACGALVKGLELSEDLTDDIMSDLTKALYNHRCLIIKNKKSLFRRRLFKLMSVSTIYSLNKKIIRHVK